MPASVELTRNSHQATRNSLPIRLNNRPSNCEIASETMIDETIPQMIMARMAATTNWLSPGPHRSTTPRKIVTAMATSNVNMAVLYAALYSGGRRISMITAMAPTTRAATAGPGARYTRDRASGISESENANDSRRKMNRKMLSSAPMKPMTITGSNQTGEGTTASPEFDVASNSAAARTEKT